MTAGNGIVFVNGLYRPQERARVSVLDRGFLYGDGLFETMRAYGGNVFGLDAHLARLRRSLELIFLDLPMTDGELKTALNATLMKNGCLDAIVRLMVSRGEQAAAGPVIDDTAAPTVVALTRSTIPLPQSAYEEGVRIALFPRSAVRTSGLAQQVKSCNYLSHIVVRELAGRTQAEEGIFMDCGGRITEGTMSNLFLVKEGRLKTPELNPFILPGITRQIVLELAAESGIPCDEAGLLAEDVYKADEVFLTNSAIEILPVRAADGRPIGEGAPGPVTRSLCGTFRDRVEKQARCADTG